MPSHPSGTQHVAPGSSRTHGPTASRQRDARSSSAGPGVDVGRPHRDELDRAVAVGVAVALLVCGMEALLELGAERQGQLERLPAKAEIGLAHLGQVAYLCEWPYLRPHVVAPLVARDEAERREDAGRLRHEHLATAELLRERARMQGAGAAERDDREVPRVVAALDRDDAQRPKHLGVDDADHRVRVDRPHRTLRGVAIEPQAARELLRQPPEQQVRVGHRRQRASVAIAGRTGKGARALGSQAQRPARVDPGDRAAAGADRVQVDGREPDREAADRALVRPGDQPADDRADVRRRPAHVERDRVLDPGQRSHPRCPDRTARGAGDEADRRVGRGLGQPSQPLPRIA